MSLRTLVPVVLLAACGSSGASSAKLSGAERLALCSVVNRGAPAGAPSASWTSVVELAEVDGSVCMGAGCGPYEAASVIRTREGEALVVKTLDGYRVYRNQILTDGAPVTKRVEDLGALVHVGTDHARSGQRIYNDWVIDPKSGEVVWAAMCQGSRAPVVTKDGETFGYQSCVAGEPPLRFTLGQADQCARAN